jgi:hypothetical protein
MTSSAVSLVGGMLITGYLVISIFFLRFWYEGRDRLFAYFAAAFFLLALQRGLLSFLGERESVSLYLYGTRAVAFLIILYAIIDKNRKSALDAEHVPGD